MRVCLSTIVIVGLQKIFLLIVKCPLLVLLVSLFTRCDAVAT
jgi:hypothetical protein